MEQVLFSQIGSFSRSAKFRLVGRSLYSFATTDTQMYDEKSKVAKLMVDERLQS